jgi:Mg-chelatase subunit ChlD
MSTQQIFQTIQQKLWPLFMFLVMAALTAACAAQPAPEKAVETIAVEKEVVREVEVVKEVEVEKVVTVEAGIAPETDSAPAARLNPQPAEPLRAGEVDDNARWDEYLTYLHNYRGPGVHQRDVSERYFIQVNDEQGAPVLDAQVTFLLAQNGQSTPLYEAKTYANGQVLFQPRALGLNLGQAKEFTVQVQKNNQQAQFTLPRSAQTNATPAQPWTVNLDQPGSPDSLELDVLFLIDATGSMADEIDKIYTSIFDVAARVDALPGQPDVRYGMVTYRDRGDSFVSQTYQFTPDVAEFHNHLSTVRADGGGDYPESLNEGLHQALHNVQWREQDTIQLVFLVADAPPHLDYANDYDYAVEMEYAARQGIKIFPIASSGLDDQGEYVFRQLAQFTQGRFIFLTYEGPTNGGAPGDASTHHVANYSVGNLDDLLVKLVQEEVAYQIPRSTHNQSRPTDGPVATPAVGTVSSDREGMASLNLQPLLSQIVPIAGVFLGSMLCGIYWIISSTNGKQE